MLRKIAILVVLAGALSVSAQRHYRPHVHVGGSAGMTMSRVSFYPSIKEADISGITAGVSFRYAEERHVGLMAEINVSQRGWKEDFEELPYAYQRRLTYVELPIMTHIFFGSRVVKGIVNLGPQVSYMLGESISSNFDYRHPQTLTEQPLTNRMVEQMAMEVSNKFDYGITAGAGVEFVVMKRHSLLLECRYYFGLGNIFPSSKKDVFQSSRPTSLMVKLGYMFRIR